MAFESALPDAFGGGDGVGGLFGAGTCCLAMKDKLQADAALRPGAFNAGVVGGEFSFVGGADGGYIEIQEGIFLGERGDFDAVDALVEAVNRGFERTIGRFRNVENQMEDGFAGLQGAGPFTFDGDSRLRWKRFVNSGRLG